MKKTNRRKFLKMAAGATAAGVGVATLGLSQEAQANPAGDETLNKYRSVAIQTGSEEALIDRVVAEGVLRAGGDLTFPPLQFRDPQTDEPMGYCVDITNAIAEDLGVEVEWVEMPFAQLIPGLQAGQFDWSGIGLTIRPQRAQAVRFIDEPLFLEDSILLANEDFTLNDASELNSPDVTFSNLTGSSQDAAAKLQFPEAEHRTFENLQDSLLEVATGRAQVSLVALWNAANFLTENPDAPVYVWEGGTLFSDMNTMMLPHGDEKTAYWLSNWYRYRGAQNFQQTLYEQWTAEISDILAEYS